MRKFRKFQQQLLFFLENIWRKPKEDKIIEKNASRKNLKSLLIKWNRPKLSNRAWTLTLAGGLCEDHNPKNRFCGKLYYCKDWIFFYIFLNFIFKPIDSSEKTGSELFWKISEVKINIWESVPVFREHSNRRTPILVS